MLKKILIIMASVLVITIRGYGFNMATHLWLGEHTLDFWSDFDPDFYSSLIADDDGRTRILYKVGLMLPDLMELTSQRQIKEMVTLLHDKMNIDSTYTFDLRWHDIGARFSMNIHIRAFSPLYITEQTYNQIQTYINFGKPLNSSIDTLWMMVEYARNSIRNPEYKALIYGAFMHVLQDMYAHMILQPSLFGYYYETQSDTEIMFLNNVQSFSELSDSQVTLLHAFENYYEIFVPTFIDTNELLGIFWHLFPANFSFDTLYHDGYLQTWQYFNHPAVDSFVAIAHRIGYGDSSLTAERLNAYLAGAGILTFLTYYADGGFVSASNLSLTPVDIFLATYNTIFSEIQISNVRVDWCIGNWCGAQHLLPLSPFLIPSTIILEGLSNEVINFAQGLPFFFGSIINTNLDMQPWYTYLENPWELDTIIEIAEQIGSLVGSNLTLSELKAMRAAAAEWDRYGQANPAHRSFYANEPQRIIALIPVLRQSFNSYVNGTPDISYMNPHYLLSRKAGILGGMFYVDTTSEYYTQPGILDMHFEVNGEYVYDSTMIPVEGPGVDARLVGDIVTFGNTINCVTVENSMTDTIITMDTVSSLQHVLISLPFDAQWAVNNGFDRVSFRIRTQNKTQRSRYWTMLDADYSSQYFGHPEIQQNPFYQRYFKYGNPVRTSSEDPLQDPKKYWPYVLSIYPTLTILNKPSNFHASVSSNLESITLTWTDRSNYEDGYIIQKRMPDSDWQTVATLAANSNSFIDNSVDPFYDYEYRIWASGNGVTSDTVYIQVSTDRVVQENVTHNDSRLPSQLVYSDDVLHMVYSASNGDIYYKYSNDNGMTWSSGTYIGHGKRPTIAASDGYVVVMWDSSGYILYRYKNGSEFSTTYRFKPQGTQIEAYSPAVEVESDTARIAFGSTRRVSGGKNSYASYVFYGEFPVTSPPSGISQFDTVWAYGRHIDTLRMIGIVSYSIGQSRYIAISFWSYGYIRYDVWGSEVHMYERLPGSSVWQNGLTGGAASYEYAEYISNPVIDKSTGMLFIGFSVGDVIDIWGKNIATGHDTIVTWSGAPICGHGPLYLANGRHVLLMTYNDENSDNMELLVLKKQGGGIDHIPMSFSSHRAAGLCVKRVCATFKDSYYALLPIDREKNGVSTRYFKNRLAYTYFVEQSPLEGEDAEVIPRSIQVDIVKNILREGEGINVKLSLPARHSVQLRIYNITGRVVNAYKDTYDRGVRVIKLDPELPAGVYFLKAEIGGKVFTRKITIIG